MSYADQASVVGAAADKEVAALTTQNTTLTQQNSTLTAANADLQRRLDATKPAPAPSPPTSTWPAFPLYGADGGNIGEYLGTRDAPVKETAEQVYQRTVKMFGACTIMKFFNQLLPLPSAGAPRG